MKFGVRLYGTDPDALVTKAQRAERLGFDSVWRGDHLLLPARIDTPYPYTQGPSSPFPTDSPILDVLVLFGFIAQATERLRLATGVYVLPLREPIAVARAVQTLDILSKGRAIFGVGVGWLREEFELLGRDFTARGRATTEAIEVLRALWTQDAPTYDGTVTSFSDVRFEPKPVQRPHPPIVVGGESAAAYQRAATIGDGWYGHVSTPAAVAPVVERLRRLREQAGRAEDPFEVTVRIAPTITPQEVDEFAAAGVDRLVLQVGSFDAVSGLEDTDAWEEFAERLVT